MQTIVRCFRERRSPGAVKKWHKTYRVLRSRHVHTFVSTTRPTTTDQRAQGEFSVREIVDEIGYGIEEHEVRRALDDHVRWERERAEPQAAGIAHAEVCAPGARSAAPPPDAVPTGPPPTLPDAWELHRRHLARALARHGAGVPAVPLLDEFVEQCIVRLGAVAEGPPRRSYGRVSLDGFLAKRPEMARARAHIPNHEVWQQTQDWLTERTAYLAALHALAGRIWRDIWDALNRDRATGSLQPPKRPWPSPEAALQFIAPKLPSDLFVVPVLLATHATLASLGVDRRVLSTEPLRLAADRTNGDGGYLTRWRDPMPLVDRPPSPPRDFEFVRERLPGALRDWSRRAGELQERWRLDLAGAPPVMDLCQQCAALTATRQALIEAFASLGPDDLHDGRCEQCRESVLPSP